MSAHFDITQILESKSYWFAKTMPEMPHFYTLKREWDNPKEFENAVLYIKENGQKELWQEKALFIDVLNMLKKQEWWNENCSKSVVDGLTKLMNADGGVVAGEIFWLEYIKKDWKV